MMALKLAGEIEPAIARYDTSNLRPLRDLFYFNT